LVDKVDLVSALLYFISALLTFVLIVFAGTNTIAFDVGLALGLFPFLYPAYWAFSIRRALAVRLFRNQALGIGLVSISFLAAIVDNTGTAYSISLFVIFYWIDASMLATRRSDPLLRDTLHWSSLRMVLWMILLVVGVPQMINGVLTGNYTYIPGNDILGFLTVAGFTIIPLMGTVLFALVSRRSKDTTLRRHLAWFGLFVLSQAVTILFASSVYSGGGATYFVGFTFGGFFLYKSAKSLVPLNRLSLADLMQLSKETSLKPDTSLRPLTKY
jgi:hypothetical protein